MIFTVSQIFSLHLFSKQFFSSMTLITYNILRSFPFTNIFLFSSVFFLLLCFVCRIYASMQFSIWEIFHFSETPLFYEARSMDFNWKVDQLWPSSIISSNIFHNLEEFLEEGPFMVIITPTQPILIQWSAPPDDDRNLSFISLSKFTYIYFI